MDTLSILEPGTALFWSVILTWAILVTWSVDSGDIDNTWSTPTSRGWPAFFSTLVLVLAMWFFGAGSALVMAANWMTEHPLSVLMFGISYLAIGSFWAIVKWRMYLVDLRRFLQKMHPTDWKTKKDPPEVGNHRDDIAVWVMWWPMSMTWSLARGPFVRSFSRLVDYLEDRMNEMGRRMWR